MVHLRRFDMLQEPAGYVQCCQSFISDTKCKISSLPFTAVSVVPSEGGHSCFHAVCVH
jgi:hypothetical protein